MIRITVTKIITAILMIGTMISLHANAKILPQDINYSAWISSLIYTNNFSTDPTLPVISDDNKLPKLEVFFVTNTTCTSGKKPISYRIHIRNTGDALAKDLFISLQSSPGTTILSSKRPANEQDNHLQTLIWQEPALVPGRFLLYTFTIEPSEDNIVQNNAVVEYLAGESVRKATTSHLIEQTCAP